MNSAEKTAYIRELELENDNLRQALKACEDIIEDMDWALIEAGGPPT